MDFLLILYILLSLAISAGGTYYFIEAERTLGGFLFFIGSILILIFYGLRWFTADVFNPSRFPSKTWPPVLNTCPDFLSQYERTVNGAKEKVCVDLIGVSEGGISRLIDPTNVVNDQYVFKLYNNLTGTARLQALCQECRTKKVTWEGIYDGVSCVASLPTADGSSGSGSEAQCP